jgi:uncharacterized protein GlcG (DUF336 family)
VQQPPTPEEPIVPESDPTAPYVPSDLTDDAAPPGTPPGISRRQALAMGGGLAAAAAVIGAGPASAQSASPTTDPTAPDPSATATATATATASPTPGIPGEPQTVQSISLAQAQEVLRLAEARAEAIGVRMNIVVVDVCGDVKAVSRQDGNGRASLVLAPLKAQTSLAFRSPTAALAANPDRARSFEAAGFTTLGGGLPIRNAAGTAVIGAIGVGGGTPEQDIDVALAGLGQSTASPSATPTDGPS